MAGPPVVEQTVTHDFSPRACPAHRAVLNSFTQEDICDF